MEISLGLGSCSPIWGREVSALDGAWPRWRVPLPGHREPQHRLPGAERPRQLGKDRGCHSPLHHSVREEGLRPGDSLPRAQGCESRGKRSLSPRPQLRSLSSCPSHGPLLRVKSCVKGARVGGSGWPSFGRAAARAHAVPFHTPRPLRAHFRELPARSRSHGDPGSSRPPSALSARHRVCEALPNDRLTLTPQRGKVSN